MILQLNVHGFFFLVIKILKAKNKILAVRASERLYFLCLNTSEMRA